jgi:TetR/AcrR family transcriptional repressor of nem operon
MPLLRIIAMYLRPLQFIIAADFEGYLEALFEQAIKHDELNDKLSAIDYARFFQVQFAELRCYFNRPGVEPLAQPMIS